MDVCSKCGWVIDYACGCPDKKPETVVTVTDSRPRGAWEATPMWLFWKPVLRRPIYAHWQLGGGLDGWEYAQEY